MTHFFRKIHCFLRKRNTFEKTYFRRKKNFVERNIFCQKKNCRKFNKIFRKIVVFKKFFFKKVRKVQKRSSLTKKKHEIFKKTTVFQKKAWNFHKIARNRIKSPKKAIFTKKVFFKKNCIFRKNIVIHQNTFNRMFWSNNGTANSPRIVLDRIHETKYFHKYD